MPRQKERDVQTALAQDVQDLWRRPATFVAGVERQRHDARGRITLNHFGVIDILCRHPCGGDKNHREESDNCLYVDSSVSSSAASASSGVSSTPTSRSAGTTSASSSSSSPSSSSSSSSSSIS